MSASREGNEPVQYQRHWIEAHIGASYLLDTILLALFAWAGSIDFVAPAAYGVVNAGLFFTFFALKRRRFQRSLPDLDINRVQHACASTVQLAFMCVYPGFAFFFLNVLFVIFGFTFLRPKLGWQQLLAEWLLISAMLGALLYGTGTPIFPAIGTGNEQALIWLSYVLAIGRCIYLGHVGNRGRANKKAQLEEWSRELETLSHCVGHDFRQPIISINGHASLLRSALGSMQGSGLRHVDRIVAASLQLEHVCEGLIRLLAVHQAQLQLQPVDITAVSHEIGWSLRQTEPMRNAVFSIDHSMAAVADPVLVRKALEALLGNAWKFTSKQPNTFISVTHRLVDGCVEFSVRDNGIGFDSGSAEDMFKVFQRLHVEEELSGTGLGLALAERVVRRHGGRIRAEGQPGQGARITFSLTR